MLKVFRDNLKHLKWVLWLVIVVLIVFLFADFGPIQQGANAGGAAAVVGDHKVSYEEFQQAYQRAEDGYRRAYGEQFSTELAKQIGLPQQVLEGLVLEKILLAEAERIGLEVSDSEVQEEILGYPVFQDEQDRFVGQQSYLQYLRRRGLTPPLFEQQIRDSLLADRVRTVLTQNVYIADSEVESLYRERQEKVKIRFLKLSTADFGDQVAIAADELGRYFGEHSEDFRVPERRIVQYLQVDRAAIQSTVEIGDDEIQRYYDENQDDFRSEEQVRARHILLQINDQRTAEQASEQMLEVRARLERGEDFAAVAGEVSEDPGSKDRGGDLGFFGRGQMVPEFEQAAFSSSPNQLVGPVQSAFGSHLIEVLARQPGGLQPLSQASARIRNRLLAERAETVTESKAQELVGRIRSEQIEDEEGLSALAEGEAGVTFQISQPFRRDDNVPGLGRASAFAVASFGLEELEVGEPVKTPRGWVIPRLLEIQEPRVPELEEVRPQVESALRSELRVSLALQRLDEAKTEISGGGSLDKIAEDLGVEVEESGLFALQDSIGSLGSAPRLATAALALEPGAVDGPIPLGGEAVLFEVVERVHFDPLEFAEAEQALREELLNQRSSQLLATLVQKRREELQVRFDPQLVENFGLGTGS